MGVCEEKSSFKMLEFSFTSKLNWGFYMVSTAATFSKNNGTWICSMKFLYIPWPWMEYCCHVWTVTPSCYLDMLDMLGKWVYRTVTPSASLELLAHKRNVVNLSPFYRYNFGRCSSELAELVQLPHFCGRSTRYSNSLHELSVTNARCYKDVYVNSFSSLWHSLPPECFPLTSNLNSF